MPPERAMGAVFDAPLSLPEMLVIASHNEGKVREIGALLAPLGIGVTASGALGLDEPEETGSSFAENARLKSHYTAQCSKLPALSDDSGLVVSALDGAPGIYSARWAGPSKNFPLAMQRIEQELLQRNIAPQGVAAQFVCVLSYCDAAGNSHEFEGTVSGTLTFPPRGMQGFGYDPIFVPEGAHLTFGEMLPDAKHAISHRARAFAQFLAFLERAGAGSDRHGV